MACPSSTKYFVRNTFCRELVSMITSSNSIPTFWSRILAFSRVAGSLLSRACLMVARVFLNKMMFHRLIM